MSEPKKNSAGLLAGFFSFLLNLATIVLTIGSFKNPELLLPALLMFVVAGAFRAYLKGILAEFLSFARLAVAFAIAWIFKADFTPVLQIKGIFGEIAGFYSLFLLIYISSGYGISIAMKDHHPSMPSKLLASLAGAFEGMLIGLFVLLAISMVPGNRIAEDQPWLFKTISGSAENIVAPILPAKAGNAVTAVKTMGKIAKGIDPAKVDVQAVHEVMRPIAEIPEVREVQSNEEIQKLIAEKNFVRLIKHPAMQKLLENQDLQKKLMELDWKKLEKAFGNNPQKP